MLKHAHKPRKIQIGGTIPQTRKWRQSGFRKCDSIYSPQCAARVRVRMCVGPCHIWLHMRICISRDLFVRVPVVTNVQSRDQAFADPATVSERECVVVYRSKCEFPQRLASLELALFLHRRGTNAITVQGHNTGHISVQLLRTVMKKYKTKYCKSRWDDQNNQNRVLGKPVTVTAGQGKSGYSPHFWVTNRFLITLPRVIPFDCSHPRSLVRAPFESAQNLRNRRFYK